MLPEVRPKVVFVAQKEVFIKKMVIFDENILELGRIMQTS